MLFTFKDKINKMLHSNLVYKFKCNVCNDIYYGKTKDNFKVRACEHLGTTPLMVGHSLKKDRTCGCQRPKCFIAMACDSKLPTIMLC